MAAVVQEPTPIYGWLRYATWTAAEAFDLSQKGQYPKKDASESTPSVTLLLNQAQFDKMKALAKKFVTACGDNYDAKDPKSFSPKEIAELIDCYEGDLAAQSLNTPFKAVDETAGDVFPEAVAMVKLMGPRGGNISQEAAVMDESEMRVPDPQIITFPQILNVSKTVHELSLGSLVIVKPTFYAYHNGRHAGFSGSVSTVVWREPGTPLSGGGRVSVDELTLSD